MVKTKHPGIFKRGSRYVVVFYGELQRGASSPIYDGEALPCLGNRRGAAMNVDEIRHFLVIYDVSAGKATVTAFDDYDTALAAYQSIEKENLGRDDLDIVLLGADSLEDDQEDPFELLRDDRGWLRAVLRSSNDRLSQSAVTLAP